MTEKESLRLEKLALLLGTMIGQISEILNSMNDRQSYLYKTLFDVHQQAGLTLHELYYKGNKS